MTDTLLTFFGITVLTNLLTTGTHLCRTMYRKMLTCSLAGLIVWRIRSVDKVCRDLITIPQRKRSRLSNVTRIIVESGLLYTTFVAVAFIAMLAGNYAAYDIVLNMVRAPNLITSVHSSYRREDPSHRRNIVQLDHHSGRPRRSNRRDLYRHLYGQRRHRQSDSLSPLW